MGRDGRDCSSHDCEPSCCAFSSRRTAVTPPSYRCLCALGQRRLLDRSSTITVPRPTNGKSTEPQHAEVPDVCRAGGKGYRRHRIRAVLPDVRSAMRSGASPRRCRPTPSLRLYPRRVAQQDRSPTRRTKACDPSAWRTHSPRDWAAQAGFARHDCDSCCCAFSSRSTARQAAHLFGVRNPRLNKPVNLSRG